MDFNRIWLMHVIIYSYKDERRFESVLKLEDTRKEKLVLYSFRLDKKWEKICTKTPISWDTESNGQLIAWTIVRIFEVFSDTKNELTLAANIEIVLCIRNASFEKGWLVGL